MKKEFDNTENEALNKTDVSISDMLDYPLHLNWFILCDSYGNILNRPKQENSCIYPDFDQDIEDGQKHYDELKKALIFPNFYIDDQIGIVTLLRNDLLDITLTVLNIHNELEVKFIECNNLGQLLNKFPKLKDFVREDVSRLSEC